MNGKNSAPVTTLTQPVRPPTPTPEADSMYVVVRLAQGLWRQVHPLMWIATAAFVLYFLVPVLQDNLSWI